MEITDSTILILSSEVNEKIHQSIQYTAGILIIIILLLIGFFMHYYQYIFKGCINSVTKKLSIKKDENRIYPL